MQVFQKDGIAIILYLKITRPVLKRVRILVDFKSKVNAQKHPQLNKLSPFTFEICNMLIGFDQKKEKKKKKERKKKEPQIFKI